MATYTVTLNSANNAHANTNLNISTGNGADSVVVLGNATFAGGATVNSQNIDFNGGLLTANGVAGIVLNAGSGAISTNGLGIDVASSNLNLMPRPPLESIWIRMLLR